MRARPGKVQATQKRKRVWFELREKHGATEFLGYDTETAEGLVLAVVRDGAVVDGSEGWRQGCRHRQPDAVLWRVRRAERRSRRDQNSRGCKVPRD